MSPSSDVVSQITEQISLPNDGDDWLDWLKADAPWELTRVELYEQYELSLLDLSLPPAVREVH